MREHNGTNCQNTQRRSANDKPPTPSPRRRIVDSQQNGPEYLYEALDYVAQGRVKSIIETYPLAEAAKAYERVAEGKTRFRAVLTM
jgi:D-arabinose 1-dehydrogenase-like Zn-dependent alcohol dehydrogenase